MTEYDKENITEILHGTGTWFTAELVSFNCEVRYFESCEISNCVSTRSKCGTSTLNR